MRGSLRALESLDALLELLEIKAEVLLAAVELLGAQKLESFLCRSGVVGVGVVHGNAIERRRRRGRGDGR